MFQYWNMRQFSVRFPPVAPHPTPQAWPKAAGSAPSGPRLSAHPFLCGPVPRSVAGPFCSSLFLGASILIDSLVFWFLYECIGTLCEESVTHFHPSTTLLQLPSCLRGPASCSYTTYKTYLCL